MMYSLMLLKRLLVGVLISAQRTGLFYLHMNHIDVPFEYNQMLERLSANGALMRTFTHVVNWKEIKN